MIKVIFKEDRKDEFNGLEYTYKDYEGAQVGDIVAVDTRYGYAIAKVTQVNIIDTKFVDEQLKEVKTIVCSIDEMKEEQEKRQKYNEVDYIITHCCPYDIFKEYSVYLITLSNIDQSNVEHTSEIMLNQIKNNIKYNKWFFGHYHVDIQLDEKHKCFLNDFVEL